MFKKLVTFYVAVLLTGCSYLPEPDPASLISLLPYLNSNANVTTIKIRSTSTSNHGTPCYVLIKATTFPVFLTEDYQKITSLVINREADSASFAIICVIPGQTQTVKVETPEDKSIAVYGLFTHPKEGWKQPLELKKNSQDVEILLGEDEILSIDY